MQEGRGREERGRLALVPGPPHALVQQQVKCAVHSLRALKHSKRLSPVGGALQS